MKQKLLFLILFIWAAAPVNKLQAQVRTVFDQLSYVNPEWKNQADAGSALKEKPAMPLTEQQLVQLHLGETEILLRRRNVSGLSKALQQSRLKNLGILHQYMLAGQFPKNNLHSGRQPYFIDAEGTYCAVGYLMKMTGADNMARQISSTQNYNYLINIQNPALMDWVAGSGLTFDELALIQPGYGGEWPSCITEMHYNNAGTDVNEYIEVHQSSGGLIGMKFFTKVLFLDNSGTLYKTLNIGQMQVSANPQYRHYVFPANESFADMGKVVLMANAETLSVYTYNPSGINLHEFYASTLPANRTFTTVEDDNTPVGQSLTFCGLYATTWSPSILPATIGTLNPCTIGAVPVVLSSFDYQNNNNSVKLKWQTGSEINSDYFEVQRSSDGIHFTTIGKVKAAGTSSILRNYTFTDAKPVYLNHYRLNQLDLDGRSSLSNILYVKCDKAVPFEIIQNPVSDALRLNVDDLAGATGDLLIYDLSGRLISTTKAKAGVQSIDVAGIAKGNYLICLAVKAGQEYRLRFQKR